MGGGRSDDGERGNDSDDDNDNNTPPVWSLISDRPVAAALAHGTNGAPYFALPALLTVSGESANMVYGWAEANGADRAGRGRAVMSESLAWCSLARRGAACGSCQDGSRALTVVHLLPLLHLNTIVSPQGTVRCHLSLHLGFRYTLLKIPTQHLSFPADRRSLPFNITTTLLLIGTRSRCVRPTTTPNMPCHTTSSVPVYPTRCPPLHHADMAAHRS